MTPLALRFLAIDLERYGNQFNPTRCAIHDFPHLEDLLFVAKDWKSANQVWASDFEKGLRVIRGAWERRWGETWRESSTAEVEEAGREGVVLWERKWPRVRVAVRCEGGRLEIVERS